MTELNEFKALTHINVPFVDQRFAPGKMISRSVFDQAAEMGRSDAKEKGIDPDSITSADEMIQNLIDGGSLGDEDAEIHPDHAPAPVGGVSVESLAAQAKAMLDSLGDDAPKEIKALAKLAPEEGAEDENE